MPIIGIPLSDPPQPWTACDEQGRREASISVVYGEPVLRRRRIVVASDGQSPTVVWVMADELGRAVDLTGCVEAPEVVGSSAGEAAESAPVLAIREATCATGVIKFTGAALDATAGVVGFTLARALLPGPGVYNAEAALVRDDGSVVFRNAFTFLIESSLFGDPTAPGPPGLDEIRLSIRDSDAAEHELIDDRTFDNAEVALAILRAVQYWNESTPDVGRYSTADFPYRGQWCRGVAAQLYLIQAEWYRKNGLTYQAGGVSVDDLNKEPVYLAAYNQLWTDYTTWVLKKKAEVNQAQCWAVVPSQYGAGGGAAWAY